MPARPRFRDSDRQSPLPPRHVLRRGAGLLTRCRLLVVPASPMSLRLLSVFLTFFNTIFLRLAAEAEDGMPVRHARLRALRARAVPAAVYVLKGQVALVVRGVVRLDVEGARLVTRDDGCTAAITPTQALNCLAGDERRTAT